MSRNFSGRFFLAIAFGDITTSTFLSTPNFSHIHNPLRQISVLSKCALDFKYNLSTGKESINYQSNIDNR